jgi:hypothetical protein
VAVGAADVAFLQFLQNARPAVMGQHCADVARLLTPNMIELEHHWIAFAAINTSFVFQVLAK